MVDREGGELLRDEFLDEENIVVIRCSLPRRASTTSASAFSLKM
jgi:hypothetical protein